MLVFYRFLLLFNLFVYSACVVENYRYVKNKEKTKLPREIPLYMWDIYNNGVNSSEIDVVKGVFPKYLRTINKIPFYHNHKKTEIVFVIPETKKLEILVKAELRITTKKTKTIKPNLQLYLNEGKWSFLEEKRIINSETDWVSLEITSKVKSLKSKSVRFLILNFGKDNQVLEPVLLLSYYTQEVLLRKKRSLGEEYEEKTNRIWKEEFEHKKTKNICRRKPLYIKFSDIDYDTWIVAPSGYEAFQCVGKCTFPVSDHLSPTKHAILQTLLHNISPSKTPRACCVPTKLEPISVLYIDNNGVLTYRFRYHDMVVSECGCR